MGHYSRLHNGRMVCLRGVPPSDYRGVLRLSVHVDVTHLLVHSPFLVHGNVHVPAHGFPASQPQPHVQAHPHLQSFTACYCGPPAVGLNSGPDRSTVSPTVRLAGEQRVRLADVRLGADVTEMICDVELRFGQTPLAADLDEAPMTLIVSSKHAHCQKHEEHQNEATGNGNGDDRGLEPQVSLCILLLWVPRVDDPLLTARAAWKKRERILLIFDSLLWY